MNYLITAKENTVIGTDIRALRRKRKLEWIINRFEFYLQELFFPQCNASKLGNGRIRKGLYFPAIVARHHNQTIKDFANRLEKNGKTSMQIVCAAMRKLLHIAFGVLKHNQPFNPNMAFSS